MPIGGFGALLGGLGEGLQQNKARQQQKELAEQKMRYDMLIDLSKSAVPSIASQANEALRNEIFNSAADTHGGKYTFTPNPLHKLVQSTAKSNIQSQPQGQGQPGVGTGNAKPTNLGVASPQPGAPAPQSPQSALGMPPAPPQLPTGATGAPPDATWDAGSANSGTANNVGPSGPPSPAAAGLTGPPALGDTPPVADPSQPIPPAQTLTQVPSAPSSQTQPISPVDPAAVPGDAEHIATLSKAADAWDAKYGDNVDPARNSARVMLNNYLTQKGTNLLKAQETIAQNATPLPMDMPQFGLKKGDNIDARTLPTLLEMHKATLPEPDIQGLVTPEGDKIINMIDKNPRSATFGKTLSTTNEGPTAESDRGAVTAALRAARAKRYEDTLKATGKGDATLTPQETLDIETKTEGAVAAAKSQAEQPFQIGTAIAIGRALGAYKEGADTNDPSGISQNAKNMADDLFAGYKGWDEVAKSGPILAKQVESEYRSRIAQGQNPPIPLSPEATKLVTMTDPVLHMVQQLKTALEAPDPTDPTHKRKLKDSNVPMGTALSQLAYKFGYETDQSGFIAKSSLAGIARGTELMQGGSRAIAALGMAMEHMPNTAKDSNKLMYDKLNNAEQNLIDVKHTAFKYGGKFGAAADDTPKPTAKPVGTYNPKTGKIEYPK